MMRWLLAGCCGLALIGLSVAPGVPTKITQRPRFYGVKTGSTVHILCLSKLNTSNTLEWYRADRHDVDHTKRHKVNIGERIELGNHRGMPNTRLSINNARTQDTGVYFCKITDFWGPGTQVTVVRLIHRSLAQHRTRMKDGLIIFQAFLLAVCIAAVLLRKQKLMEKSDSIYEEPETDHIYEGLAIEACGGGLYEELSVYAQAEGAEAPWE